MRLIAFRIINCFGFHDSGDIDLSDPQSLFYVLGRNSSGKSAFLEALDSFRYGIVPSELYTQRFANFEPTEHEPVLVATYSIAPGEVDLQDMFERIYAHLAEVGITREEVALAETLRELMNEVVGLYAVLVRNIESTQQVRVLKHFTGEYEFSVPGNDFNFKDRMVSIRPLLEDALGAHSNALNVHQLESFLYPQFPQPLFVTRNLRPADVLPDVITQTELMNMQEGTVLEAFVSYVGYEALPTYVAGSHLTTRAKSSLHQMQSKVNELIDKINQRTSGIPRSEHDLLGMQLEPHAGGLQVTVITDKKTSLYRHISGATKALFNLALFLEVHGKNNSILLFDEPNSGLHPSVQRILLEYLKLLAHDKVVIISTHSEHMIDTSYLSGVLTMGVDANNALSITKGFTVPVRGTPAFLAYQPLLQAMGYITASQLILFDKVVITEGINDLYYLQAFRRILSHEDDLHLAPVFGDNKMRHLISFLISQGVRFKIVIDDSVLKGNEKSAIQAYLPISDDYFYVIPIPEEYSGKMYTAGIEDLFTKRDFAMLLDKVGHVVTDDFEHRSNSDYLKKDADLKGWVALYVYTNAGNLRPGDFEEGTWENFKKVLDYCASDVWFSL